MEDEFELDEEWTQFFGSVEKTGEGQGNAKRQRRGSSSRPEALLLSDNDRTPLVRESRERDSHWI